MLQERYIAGAYVIQTEGDAPKRVVVSKADEPPGPVAQFPGFSYGAGEHRGIHGSIYQYAR